jgi:hypothetical protein
MWSKSFEEMGIPPGYGFKQLLFSPFASVLVVQAQSSGKNWRPERLYFRHIELEKYNAVEQPADLISQDSPFVHPSKPLLAYNCLEHRFSVDASGEERHSGDWDSLHLYDLEQGVEVDSINRNTLILPPGIVRGWISGIVAFNDSGLFVKAGLSKEGSSRMDYVVAELDLSHRVLNPVVALPATFI